MEIESKGMELSAKFEISFMCAFDSMYKAKVPIEVMPGALIETYKADSSFRPGMEGLYTAFVNTYFEKWKKMNGL